MSIQPVGMKGVCLAEGFSSAGVEAGIKRKGGLDLGLLVSDRPAAFAGTFTTNRAAAAPVKVSRERVPGTGRGVVVNSGCANACTGERGLKDARAMASIAEEVVGAGAGEMLVCSTGLIGSYLPMDKIGPGIKRAGQSLSLEDDPISQAILTSDTRHKRYAVRHSDGWALGGIAKGAGMIAPNMATMLAFVTTDAEVEPRVLQSVLAEVVDRSFNAITIDGDTSTNDTVLAFANGASGEKPDIDDLASALNAVCRSLARQIVSDGEGMTKLVVVKVTNAAHEEDARLAARTIAESPLVKTAMYGAVANWGRVAAAIGRSQVEADYDRLSISLAGYEVLHRGSPAGEEILVAARKTMRESSEIAIECDLAAGDASAEVLTTDLSPEYVQLNAAYE